MNSRSGSVSAPSAQVGTGSRTASILSSQFSQFSPAAGSDPSSRVNSVFENPSASRTGSITGPAALRPEEKPRSRWLSIDLAWATRLELIVGVVFFSICAVTCAVIVALVSTHAASTSRATSESALALLAHAAARQAEAVLTTSLRDVELAARAAAAGSGAGPLLADTAALASWGVLEAGTGALLAGTAPPAALSQAWLSPAARFPLLVAGPTVAGMPSLLVARPVSGSSPSSLLVAVLNITAAWSAALDAGPAALAAAGWPAPAPVPSSSAGLALFAPSGALLQRTSAGASGDLPAARAAACPAGQRLAAGGAGGLLAGCAAPEAASPLAGYSFVAWTAAGEAAGPVREMERLVWIPAIVGCVLAAVAGVALARWIARPVARAVEAVMDMLSTQLREQGWSGPPGDKNRLPAPAPPPPLHGGDDAGEAAEAGEAAPPGAGFASMHTHGHGRHPGPTDSEGEASLPDSSGAAGGPSNTEATSGEEPAAAAEAPPTLSPPGPALSYRSRARRGMLGAGGVKFVGAGPGGSVSAPDGGEATAADGADAAAPPPAANGERTEGGAESEGGDVESGRGVVPPLQTLPSGTAPNAPQSRRHSSLSTLISVWERDAAADARAPPPRSRALQAAQDAVAFHAAATSARRRLSWFKRPAARGPRRPRGRGRVEPEQAGAGAGQPGPPLDPEEEAGSQGCWGGFAWYAYPEAHALHEALGLLRSAIQRATSVDRINERLELKVADRTRALQRAVERARKEAGEKERIRATLEKMRLHEAASMARSQFIASLNHELRTPLNAICGLTRMLLDTELDETQRDWLETVRLSSEALLSLIADVLDYSKLECQKLRLEEQPFAIEDVVEESCDVVAFKAAEKGLRLCHCVTWAPGVPRALLMGDSSRVRQILMNLLNNATKFSDTGSIDVRCRVETENPTSGLLRVTCSVSDEGIGIDASSIDKLFVPFNQASESIFRKYGGTGLGLSICKELCRLMGDGSISVESEVGAGSTFTFVVFLRLAGLPEGAGPAALHGAHDREGEGEALSAASHRAMTLERPSVAGIDVREWNPFLRGRSLLFYTKSEVLATFVAVNATSWGVAVVRCTHKADVAAALQGRGTYAWVCIDMHSAGDAAMRVVRAGAWRAPAEVRERRASTWDEAHLRAVAAAEATAATGTEEPGSDGEGEARPLRGPRASTTAGRPERRGSVALAAQLEALMRSPEGAPLQPGLAAIILLTHGRRGRDWEREGAVVGGGAPIVRLATPLRRRQLHAALVDSLRIKEAHGEGGGSPRATSPRDGASSRGAPTDGGELPAVSWREERAPAPSASPAPHSDAPPKPRALGALAKEAGGASPSGRGTPSGAGGSFDGTLGARHPLAIIVAEDNLLNQKVVINFLRKLGYTDVALAADGTQAIDLLRARWRPVILMDIQMSPMGGVEATDRILAEWSHQPPAIFAVTANAMPADLDLYKRKGFSGCIPKPILVGDLVRALESVPPPEPGQADSPRPAPAPPPPAPAPAPAPAAAPAPAPTLASVRNRSGSGLGLGIRPSSPRAVPSLAAGARLPPLAASTPPASDGEGPPPLPAAARSTPPGTPPPHDGSGVPSPRPTPGARRTHSGPATSAGAAGAAGSKSSPIFDGTLAQRRPMRLLVADDNNFNVKVAVTYLRKFGFIDVAVATSGRQAVEAVRKDKPDVVLMDIMMETSTAGVDAAEQIRAELGPRSPIIIGVTGDTDAGSAAEYMRRGLTHVIHKPLIAEQLYEVLASLPVNGNAVAPSPVPHD